MNKKGLVTIEILTILFVPGMLTLYVVTKLVKLLNKFHLKRVEELQ